MVCYHAYMHLTVLQWNVWYQEKIERVLTQLQSYSADIICLQELTRGYVEQSHENTWEYLAHELGFFYCAQEIPIITADTQWSQANAILSRFPIEASERVWLHEPTDPQDMHDQFRGYLEATIAIGDSMLTVATTHMSFNTGPDRDPELDTLLGLLHKQPRNYVLTGDLNALPESRRVTELAKLLQHAGPSYEQKTWTTKSFRHETFQAETLDWRFDYIFTSSDVPVVSAYIPKTDVSDHLPVLATIDIADTSVR
jgi:endonuclease/exonuclease/phosphatase family metal-dependent hydrolase